MDLLKRELEKKRKAATADFGGKSFVRRSELEQKQLQKRRDEHRQLLAKAGTSAPSANSAAAATGSEERRIDELDLPRHEVVRREPVTLFGEDDDARLSRFKLVLKSGVIDDIDMTEGQTNDFLRDMIEMRKRQKAGRDTYAKGKSKRVDDGGAAGGSADDGDAKGSGDDANADKDSKRMRTKFEELCNEDKILVFFKKLLNEWNQELDEMTELEKRTAKGKSMVATFKQCARYLSPLFEFCRKKVLPDDIRRALLVIVECCMKRDYLAAMDQYIKLTIGNAPWPIGVTMVGIHERSAREKIYTNSVAHIMNDETTRKYLQSIKRLMTLSQRRYPALPSKSVEFNSLANGSDLQALLSEENGSAKASEERLRLMPAYAFAN
ncbi:pre-mRNA-splicing factor 18-like [Zea mays]|uniref:Pre-mRNA-splicing factor 18 n=1 Tax=Zea mays TaxID=4577 RepID=B6U5W5_MAIZE|nr:pre-mRNA-splicing factor 18-like [Zea mays]ACG44748.1 prp18 domain containing protein [Zea mays]|eukprot:NP_001151882.1 prp18 domain containing protein [Zea mays]